MKKFFGLFILAISLFVLSCSNFSNVGDNSTLGKIAIQLPASSKNARNVIVASAESTEYYVITLEGPSPTSVRDTGGSVVTFKELLPGEYTITVEAYSVEGYCISSASATAIVRAGETTSINLALPRNVLANTKFALWNYDNGSYNFKTFSSTPTNDDLIIQSGGDSFIADNTCTVEDNDGKIYHIYQKNVRMIPVQGGDIILVATQGAIIDAPLYCDETTNSVYLYLFNGTKNETALWWIDSSKIDAVYCSNIPRYTVSGMPSGTPKMFAIRASDFYVVVEDNGVERLYYMTLSVTKEPTAGSTPGEISVSTPKQILSVAPSVADPSVDLTGISEVRGKFTDITIASDGTVYALICDHSDFSIPRASSNGVALETPIYSRGAIAKITSDGNVSYLGYHDNVRNLTTNVGNYNIDWSDESYYGSVKLYAPNKAQSSTEFYGPQKIIAKKPDELYIVDCGVNFMLAGFNPNNPAHNADSTGQEESGYHSGNAFIHNRIMKVDLKSFALGTVAEQVTVNSYNNQGSLGTNINDIFGCVALNNITPFANLLGYSGHFLCGPATVEDEI